MTDVVAGEWIANVPIPEGQSLERAERRLSGTEQAVFLNFVRGMLAWRPEDRKTAKELSDDPWLRGYH
jgi:hypothetical protein